jgi:hypothetical protein
MSISLSALKTIPLRETMRLEFRGEFYSSFTAHNNATVFGTPGFAFAAAGRDPRLVQLGLKLYY